MFIFIGISLGMYLYFLLYEWQAQTKTELIELYSWKNFSSFTLEGLAMILLSIGYCALFVYLCNFKLLKSIMLVFANVGRMAFSNYIMQTIICVILFYVFKFYGKFNLMEITIFSIGIIIFQLIASYLCIQYFRTGPIEYVWRKLAQRNLPSSAINKN
jgi:uncharacterized protein